MPSGFMPTYKYRPARVKKPWMRIKNHLRARLWAGGTYFRAKNPGLAGNNISIELVEFVQDDVKVGKLVITNRNTAYEENVVGPAIVNFLDQQLSWKERWQIEDLTTQPLAHRYSISLQIAPTVTDLVPFVFREVFTIPSKLMVKLTPKPEEFTQNAVITIKPRVRVYDLVLKAATSGGESGTSTPEGWDAELLRAAVVAAADPWIEMMPRSGTPTGTAEAPATPLTVKFDEQDNGIDEPMFVFPDTLLSGGDGLPDNPTAEDTGPSRSLILIKYGEQYNGALGDVNKVYEWAGTSAQSGAWEEY